MKKILLTVVLGVAVSAVGQTAQPAPGQPATPPAQGQAAAAPAPQSAAPVIKDPAEYNAYVSAVDPAKDANAKISGLEAFLTQYPNSVMKNQALEILMGTYQQANNPKKTMDTATKLVTADTCNVRALTLLSYFDRVIVQSSQANDPNVPQLLSDGKKYGQQGLDCLPKVTDPELLKNKGQMEVIFKSAIGIADFQGNDFAGAASNLRPAADANPTDFSVVYPLALAYLKQTPPDYQNGIWFAARAAAIAPAAAQAGVEKYARSPYVKFHSADDGWAELLAAVLDALGWDSAHLLGASMGGQLAQRAALRHPSRVRSVTSLASLPSDAGRLSAGRYVRLGLVAKLARLKFPAGRDGDIALGLALARAVASPGYPFDEAAARGRIERDVVSG